MSRTSHAAKAACRSLLVLVGLLGVPGASAADTVAAPGLECALSIEATRTAAASLPGATSVVGEGTDLIRAELPDVWIVEYSFTTADHPAHPAVTLRTQLKQVTEVWTSQSKGCGFGDQASFVALMAEMKAQDTELTNASRAEVEKTRGGPLTQP